MAKTTEKAEAENPEAIEEQQPKDDGKVDFYAFRDSDKYKDDITVIINGKAYRIQRGKHVRIPKAIAEILEHSMEQDAKTAALIERESGAYERDKARLE